MIEWIKYPDISNCCLQEIHFTCKNTHKIQGWKKIKEAKENQRKAPGAMLPSEEIDF